MAAIPRERIRYWVEKLREVDDHPGNMFVILEAMLHTMGVEVEAPEGGKPWVSMVPSTCAGCGCKIVGVQYSSDPNLKWVDVAKEVNAAICEERGLHHP